MLAGIIRKPRSIAKQNRVGALQSSKCLIWAVRKSGEGSGANEVLRMVVLAERQQSDESCVFDSFQHRCGLMEFSNVKLPAA